MKGWISLHRELIDKPIWTTSDPVQKNILVTLMLMANHEPNEWEFKGEKFTVQSGQMITSLESIVQKCGKGVTIQNVRTSLKRFEKYGFLTSESTNKNRLITIVNYGFYQGRSDEPNKQTNKQLTSNQQATNKQLTTNNNDNNNNNDNKDNKNHIYKAVIDRLNEKTDSNFKHNTQATKSSINGRLNEGHKLEDFLLVIDFFSEEWKGKTFSNGTKGDDYLKPTTLFNTKFDERLNKARRGNNGKSLQGSKEDFTDERFDW